MNETRTQVLPWWFALVAGVIFIIALLIWGLTCGNVDRGDQSERAYEYRILTASEGVENLLLQTAENLERYIDDVFVSAGCASAEARAECAEEVHYIANRWWRTRQAYLLRPPRSADCFQREHLAFADVRARATRALRTVAEAHQNAALLSSVTISTAVDTLRALDAEWRAAIDAIWECPDGRRRPDVTRIDY